MTSLGAPASALAAWAAVGLTWQTAASAGYPSSLFNPIRHDFGPRLGVAYQLNHNTVVRGSYGIYYVPEPLNLLLQSMRNNPPINLAYQNQIYTNPNVTGGASGAYFGLYPYVTSPAANDYMPPAVVNVASGSANPENNTITTWDAKNWNDSRDQTWNLTVEHELPMHTGLRLSYIGAYGGNLLQEYAINDPEPNYNYASHTGLLPPGDTNKLRGVVQWGGFGDNHTGYSRSHAFQAELHRNFASGLSYQLFYTFTRQLTTTDPAGSSLVSTSINGGAGSGKLGGSGGSNVPESFEIKGEPSLTYAQRLRLTYFNSTTIPPHHLGFNTVYELPFGKGKYFARNSSTALNYLIGGWQVATIGVWNSGLWMGLTSSLVQPGNVRIPANKRAMLNYGSKDRQVQWFAGVINPASATNVQGTLVAAVARQAGPNCAGSFNGQLAVTLANGNCYSAPFSSMYNPAPRNNIIGPGAWNDDFSLYKHFKIGEKVDMRFSADAFNFTNHPNNNPPNPTTGLQDLALQNTALNTPRQIQLSLRLAF